MSVVENCEKLYDDLINKWHYKQYDMAEKIRKILLSIKKEHLKELKEEYYDYCFAALISLACSKEEFYGLMDDLMIESDEEVFKWIIDYNGEKTDGRNPIDSGVFPLAETFDIIDAYYDSRYYLVYTISSYSEFPTYIDYIIGNNKENGKKKILEALGDRVYTKEQFDVAVLDGMWEEYHGE